MSPELEMLLGVTRMLLLAGLILLIFQLWLNTPEDMRVRRSRKPLPAGRRLKEPVVITGELA